MQATAPAPFEVHCDRCRVTFPVGTRRCIHCGAPTTRTAGPRGLRAEPARSEVELETADDPDLEVGPRRLFSPLTLVWIVLIVAGYLVRACSGERP